MRVCPSVGWSVGRIAPRSATCFFKRPKMDNFLYENHRGSPTLNVLNVLNVLKMLKRPKDSSACIDVSFLPVVVRPDEKVFL